jgi:hypothetical protein
MKQYEEFINLKIIEDKNNPFSTLYELEDGSRFYIEPGFYSQMMGFKTHRKQEYPLIVNALLDTVRKNKKVIFTADFDIPQTEPNDDEYIILEILDITDPLQIFVEDKSRGSDYGD